MKYGDIPQPEEQQRIEVIEDPTKVLLAGYETYRQLVPAYTPHAATPEMAYNIACKLLEGKEHLTPDADALVKAVSVGRPSEINKDTSGIFLSAVLNKTKLDTLLVDNSPIKFMGYRLAPGRFLAVNSYYQLYNVGEQAEGGILVTIADAERFAKDATCGVQINFGLKKDWQQCTKRKAGTLVDWTNSHCEPECTEGATHMIFCAWGQWLVETCRIAAAGHYRNSQFLKKNTDGAEISVKLPPHTYEAPWKNAALQWAGQMEGILEPLSALCRVVSLNRIQAFDRTVNPNVLGFRTFDWDGLRKSIEAEAKQLEDILP